MSHPSPKTEFFQGARDTLPMIVGAIPFGIIFGALGVSNGLSVSAVVGMSVFVFAGSSQFLAVGLVGQGVGIGLIIFTTLIVNLRHMLYGASLAQYVAHLSQRWLVPLGFWLTDETYATVIRRYPLQDNAPYKHWYQFGSSVAMYSNWVICTLIGIVAGTQLKELTTWGLDFAMVVTFIGIVVPMVVTRPLLFSALIAGSVAIIANPLPNKLGLMVASLAGIIAGVWAEWASTRHTVIEGVRS